MQVVSLGLGFQVWQSRNEISASQHPWCVHRVVIELGHLDEVNGSTETAWQESLHESIFSGSCCVCHTGYVHVWTWWRPMRWRAFSPRDFGHFHGQRKGRNPTGNANWVRFKTIHIWCIYINLKYGWLKTIDDKFCAGPLASTPRRTGSTNEFRRWAQANHASHADLNWFMEKEPDWVQHLG